MAVRVRFVSPCEQRSLWCPHTVLMPSRTFSLVYGFSLYGNLFICKIFQIKKTRFWNKQFWIVIIGAKYYRQFLSCCKELQKLFLLRRGSFWHRSLSPLLLPPASLLGSFAVELNVCNSCCFRFFGWHFIPAAGSACASHTGVTQADRGLQLEKNSSDMWAGFSQAKEKFKWNR